MNVVYCEGINKYYNQEPALQNFTVQIPQNHIVGILGPNGAGKSTFFRMLMGHVRQDEGSIQVLNETPSWKLNDRIAFLPDRARWYGNYTVAKTIEYGKNFLSEFDVEKAEKLADKMKLEQNMVVSKMSRGQEAKLMLLLCMARNVPLVILDEPFSGIDLISKEQIMEAIIELAADRAQTILISTHEIAETEGLFDYVVFFKDGQAVLAGEVEELRRTKGSLQDMYRNLYR